MYHARLMVELHGAPESLELASDDVERTFDHDLCAVAQDNVSVAGYVLTSDPLAAERTQHREAGTRQQLVFRHFHHFHVRLAVGTRLQPVRAYVQMLL